MPKNKEQDNTPDYESVKTVEDVQQKIEETKNTIVRKFRLQEQVKENKKTVLAGYTDQLKHLKEELEHELGCLGGWEDRLRVLGAMPDADDPTPKSSSGQKKAGKGKAQSTAPVAAPTTLPASPPPIPMPPTVV